MHRYPRYLIERQSGGLGLSVCSDSRWAALAAAWVSRDLLFGSFYSRCMFGTAMFRLCTYGPRLRRAGGPTTNQERVSP